MSTSPSQNDGGSSGANSTGATLKIAFPQARVKTIMKEDKDVGTVSHDAVFAVAYATELFLELMAQKSYDFTRQEQRKTVTYKDVATAVSKCDELEFLSGIFNATVWFYGSPCIRPA
ncbi:hypothetical protein HK104_005477 [Borealophlyctis nickersoniae]|nr:hypothetical protein HK104_005477 [Borealophlyctis nickersoniae]